MVRGPCPVARLKRFPLLSSLIKKGSKLPGIAGLKKFFEGADIFLEAARRIGVEPKFCRAYEDTDLGLQAIRSASMEAVDVRHLRG